MDWSRFFEGFTQPFFNLQQTPVSLATIAQFVVSVIVVVGLSRLTRRLLRQRVLPRTRIESGLQELAARVAGLAVLVLGLMVALSTLGFDLTSLTVLGGALGIGIGFGLQNIVENFVSGLIILLERPIQVGHRVEVGGTAGTVTRIGPRSTCILTNDNITIIIPNSEFISERVVNWSHGGDRRVRIRVPVGVAYGTDVQQVERLLLEVARENAAVLPAPEPVVVLLQFGESALQFELRVWMESMSHRPGAFRSQLNFAIHAKLAHHGIEIPFPQRDLHLRGPVQVDLTRPVPDARS